MLRGTNYYAEQGNFDLDFDVASQKASVNKEKKKKKKGENVQSPSVVYQKRSFSLISLFVYYGGLRFKVCNNDIMYCCR